MILPKLKVESWNWGVELYIYKFNWILEVFENYVKISDWAFIIDIVNHAKIWNEIWGKRFVNDMDAMSLGVKWWNRDLLVHLELC